MNNSIRSLCLLGCLWISAACPLRVYSQNSSFNSASTLKETFTKPWVVWYWMKASFSRQGIIADLDAMQEAGIEGAYLAPIKGKENPPLFEPAIETLTPQWWDIFKFAVEEAAKRNIKIAMFSSDGFATTGGPWISPALSMQKVVWTKIKTTGGKFFSGQLEQPESYEGYYEDIAVLAFPTRGGKIYTSFQVQPKVSTSTGEDAGFLLEEGNQQNFSAKAKAWIQYEFKEPFLCRSIEIRVNNFNFQANRLLIEASDDGKNFKTVTRLMPPRTGWLDWDAATTHSIVPTRARYFRFVYDPEGTEPGAEDIDMAKWSPSLKVTGIILSSEAKINQYEGRNGMVWRIGQSTTEEQIPASLCVPKNQILNLTAHMDQQGKLNYTFPAGEWTILRIGHTSTGHKNETAGNGKGLEADKFNPKALQLQFDNWYGKACEAAGPELSQKVLKVFHVDSWECGSQNWSPVFRQEFIKRRGYDPLIYLPVMAGIPVESAEISEAFLYDIRKTQTELLNDSFYETFKKLAHDKGVIFSAETTAPVMVSNGLRHFKTVDVAMGEFWAKSPSHDKPNDVLDAVSGAHIYGKNIIAAEAFTTIRMEWNEHPRNLKTLQDRNYALGVNELIYHLFVHNPWIDRKPGMTLDGIGLYFQRDQTWWKPGKAWVKYAGRCHYLLQQGQPVVDIAVFTGEEFPLRSVLPDRLVSTLPGIFGEKRRKAEMLRLANEGQPTQKVAGVTTSANMAQPENWINPLRGYAYDSFDPKALAEAKVKEGKVVMPGGLAYQILVFPGARRMNPANRFGLESLQQLKALVLDGATVMVSEKPVHAPGILSEQQRREFEDLTTTIWEGDFKNAVVGGKPFISKQFGKGLIIKTPYEQASLNHLGIEKDFIVTEQNGKEAEDVAFNHRQMTDSEIYFISNQQNKIRNLKFSLRSDGKIPEFYDAVTGETRSAKSYSHTGGRTLFSYQMAENASVFVMLRNKAAIAATEGSNNRIYEEVKTLGDEWNIQFDESFGGPREQLVNQPLFDWTLSADPKIKYYSGTVVYRQTFKWKSKQADKIWLDLGEVHDLATVTVNGVDCGVVWTAPNKINISKALKKGKNELEIAVSNTWGNRLIGDEKLPEKQRVTQTTAPFRLQNKALEQAGLLGPVIIQKETN